MALDDDIAILERTPFLALMERDAQRLISFAAERRTLAQGETLFRRGEPGDGGYVVLSGTLALAPRHRAGEPVLAGSGALVGRHALLLAQPRPTTATARTACEVMRVSPELMRRVLAVFPAAAEAIRDALADDLAELAAGLAGSRMGSGGTAGPG